MSLMPSQDDQYLDLVALSGFVRWIQRVILVSVLLVFVSVMVYTPTSWVRYANLSGVVAAVGLSYWLQRRSVLLAAKVLLFGMWLVASAGLVLLAGVHSANMLLYPFIVAAAGWILGRQWLTGLTVLTLVFVLLVGLAEVGGFLVPTPRSSPLVVIAQVLLVIGATAMVAQRAREISLQSRDRAVALSQALEQQIDEVAARERQVVQLMDNMPAGVASFDAQLRLRNCNQRYADLFGTTAYSLQGHLMHDYVPAAQLDVVLPMCERALTGQPQNYRRVNINPKTGVKIWLDGSLRPEFQGERVIGLYAMLVDVTDKVCAEDSLKILNDELEGRVAKRTAELARTLERLHESREELVRSQAKAGLAALVASVSHELSTPIGNSVLVSSSLADMSRQLRRMIEGDQLKKSTLLDLNTALGEGSQMLVRNLARAEELLRNFKQMSADQASEQRRVFDVATVVREVVASLAPSLKDKPHQIVVDIAPDIEMDSLPGPLGQVIVNLINNAYHHAFDEGQTGLLRIEAVANVSDLVLRVSDNGRGMAQEVLLHLVEPFFSTKIGKGGTGLGMSIVDSIVRKTLGGTMQVDSTEGEGTRYELTLPRVAPPLSVHH